MWKQLILVLFSAVLIRDAAGHWGRWGSRWRRWGGNYGYRRWSWGNWGHHNHHYYRTTTTTTSPTTTTTTPKITTTTPTTTTTGPTTTTTTTPITTITTTPTTTITTPVSWGNWGHNTFQNYRTRTTTTPTTTPTTTTTTPGPCHDPGKLALNVTGRMYSFSSIQLGFHAAQDCCEKMGMILASIETQQEQLELANAIPNPTNWWIGLLYIGYWHWLSGNTFAYSNWIATPSSAANCAHLITNAEWIGVANCVTPHRFICEKN